MWKLESLCTFVCCSLCKIAIAINSFNISCQSPYCRAPESIFKFTLSNVMYLKMNYFVCLQTIRLCWMLQLILLKIIGCNRRQLRCSKVRNEKLKWSGRSFCGKYSNLIVSYIDFLLLFFNFYIVIILGPALNWIPLPMNWKLCSAKRTQNKYNRKWISLETSLFQFARGNHKRILLKILHYWSRLSRNDSWLQINIFGLLDENKILVFVLVFDFV